MSILPDCNSFFRRVHLAKKYPAFNLKRILTITKIAGLVAALYLLLSLSFYFFHDKIVFRPKKLSRDYSFQFDLPFEEIFIPMPDGIEINALLFQSANQPKGLILYFHGNKDNLQRWGQFASDFTSLDYDVLMVDYRGYGKSGGKPDEQGFYNDAQMIWNWAHTKFTYDTNVIYGRSLGAAVASNLAISTDPALLILETPFDELLGVVYPVFKPTLCLVKPKFRFSNFEHLQQVNCQKILIHGSNDGVVPLSSALRLKELLHPADEFVLIEGGGHNNLRDYDAYHDALKKYLK